MSQEGVKAHGNHSSKYTPRTHTVHRGGSLHMPGSSLSKFAE